MLIFLAGVFEVNVPNAITVFRIILIPFFIWQFLEGHLEVAAIIFFVAWVSDVLDGYIARKYNLVTDFGKVFDPLADKLITLIALFLLAYDKKITILLPIIVLAKEIVLAIGGAFLYKVKNKVVGAKWVGKIATFLFAAAIILMMFKATEAIASVIAWIAVAVAFIALITYVVNFFKVVKVKESE